MKRAILLAVLIGGVLLATPVAGAQPLVDTDSTSELLRTAFLLTLLAFVPAVFVSMTSFIRIAIVLAMVRHAFGMPETPPNAVLVSDPRRWRRRSGEGCGSRTRRRAAKPFSPTIMVSRAVLRSMSIAAAPPTDLSGQISNSWPSAGCSKPSTGMTRCAERPSAPLRASEYAAPSRTALRDQARTVRDTAIGGGRNASV